MHLAFVGSGVSCYIYGRIKFLGKIHRITKYNMVKQIFSILLALFATVSIAQQRPGSFRGTVTDKQTGEPVPFANVAIKDDGGSIIAGGETDFDGKFNINPVTPGNHLVEVSSIGYATVKLKGVVISQSKATVQNFKLQEQSTVIGEVTIKYEAPLIDPTKTSKITTAEDIQQMAVRDITSVAAQAAGVSVGTDGTSIRGGRPEGTVYFIDGIKVRGSISIPQAAIASTEVITGGLPAQYGDAIGGVINTTTKGPTGAWFGNAEILTSFPFQFLTNSDNAPILDGQNYNLGAFTIGGPLYKNKKGQSVVGFLFSSEFSYIEETRPVPNDIPYMEVDPDVLRSLEQTPISIANQGRAINFNAEFVDNNDLNPIYRRPNAHSNNVSLSGNVQIKSSRNTMVTVGGRYVYNNDPNASYGSHVFNYANNSQSILNDWQAYARFQQAFPNDTASKGLIKNVFYNIQVDYSRRSATTFDPEFEKDFFKYGYTGKYDIQQRPAYAQGVDTTSGLQGALFVGFQDTALAYTPADFNTVRTNYISEFLRLADENPGLEASNVFDILGYGLPVNGSNPRSVYGLWANVGTQQAGYSESRLSQFRVTASSNFDIGDHSIIVGFEYEQRVDRAYSLGAQDIWTRMRLLQNQPNEQLDIANPSPVFDEDDNYQDTVNYYYRYDANASSQFSESVRAKLGLDPKGTERLNVDNLDPSLFSLDMFSADEVINPNGARGVSYYGYDYTGELLDNQPTIDEFFTARDENGRFTRPVGAFRPLYIAGYIQDQFTYRDLTFNVGVRVDRFDLNQSVLRDPYILPPFYTVGDIANTELAEQASQIPAGIGQDYAVYVNDFDYGNATIVGYRDGDQFYNADGEPISDPSLLSDLAGGGIKPFLVNPPESDDPTTDVDESALGASITSESFRDYDPQVVVMPRIAFNFPITDEAIFIAHYDVLAQRPTSGLSRLDPFQYLDLQNLRNGGLLNNPNLLPQKTTEYEIAFKQALSQKSALKIAAFYRELRDLLQAVNYPEAYPITYVAYGNRDFGTVKGFQIEYELRRTNNLKIDANYTLQFASGTGSSASTGLNLARVGAPALRTLLPFDYDNRHQFLVRLDWRYGQGLNYNGPKVNGKNILENFGVNLVMNANSGRPYTKRDRAYAVTASASGNSQTVGQVNGARLPWQVSFDMRINKSFMLTKNGKRSLDVYLQILNLFNTMNIINVYPFTGSPDDDGFLASEQGRAQLVNQVDQQSFVDLYNRSMNSPFNFSIPRRIRLGISYNF